MAFSRCQIPALAGRAATRAVLCRLIVLSSVHDFTKSISSPSPVLSAPRTEAASDVPRERPALPRPEMPSFGRRWSAAPPHGGSPFGWAKEPSTNGRRSHGLCRPGPTRRRPSLEGAPHRVLRRRRGFSLELVPARELSAACLTDDRRKLRFFGPRRSDRILQHDMTHGHDLYGLLLLSRAGLAGPGRVRPCSRWRAVSILRNRLDEPSRAHPPCALLHGSLPEHRAPSIPSDHGATTYLPRTFRLLLA
jgi:hypothetical protein